MIIKELRGIKKITQRELADMANVSMFYLNRIERGKCIPQKKTLARIATVLGVNIPTILLEGEHVGPKI